MPFPFPPLFVALTFPPPSPYPRAPLDLKECLKALNADLQHCQLAIRGMIHKGAEIYGIVNLVSAGSCVCVCVCHVMHARLPLTPVHPHSRQANDDVAKAHASKMKDW